MLRVHQVISALLVDTKIEIVQLEQKSWKVLKCLYKGEVDFIALRDFEKLQVVGIEPTRKKHLRIEVI